VAQEQLGFLWNSFEPSTAFDMIKSVACVGLKSRMHFQHLLHSSPARLSWALDFDPPNAQISPGSALISVAEAAIAPIELRDAQGSLIGRRLELNGPISMNYNSHGMTAESSYRLV